MERPKDTKLVSKEEFEFLLDYWESFLSERGLRVLSDLREKYGNALFDKDPCIMAYRVGQRDVIMAIEEVLETKNQGVQVEEEVKDG